MRNQIPLTMMQLARQRLLKEEALVISTLEDLPMELLPEIFEEAFNEKRTNILRAIVAVWPFPCLRAGILIKIPCLETFKALLDGLDILIAETLHPRRLKLRVLDLTHVRHVFWSSGAQTHEGDCSSQAMRQKQPTEICPMSGVRKRFIVVTDLELSKAGFNECDTYLLHWAQYQRVSVHLCCRKLQVLDSPVFTAVEFFKIIHLECVLQLQMSQWYLQFMAQLFPYLSQMRHLHTLVLAGSQNHRLTASSDQGWISSLLSLFFNFPCLQNLHVNGIDFVAGCFEQWLRCMKMPLKTLSITNCRLSQADFSYLSQCTNICELRHLNLSSTMLSDKCPNLLGVLLQRIKRTLRTLELEECEMGDTHFNAILSALSQCSQLTQVNFYHNNISLYALKNLLRHTARLNKLKYELYPAPLECYEGSRILRDKFQQICPQLLAIPKAKRQPKKIYFWTRLCLDCFEICYYDGEARLCLCEQVE